MTDATEKIRAEFEADSITYGFDITRFIGLSPEPWDEYENSDTGHR